MEIINKEYPVSFMEEIETKYFNAIKRIGDIDTVLMSSKTRNKIIDVMVKYEYEIGSINNVLKRKSELSNKSDGKEAFLYGCKVQIEDMEGVEFVNKMAKDFMCHITKRTHENPPSAEKYKQAELDRLRKRIIKLSEGDRVADSWECLGKTIDEWEKRHNDKFMILGLEVKDKFVGGVLGVEVKKK